MGNEGMTNEEKIEILEDVAADCYGEVRYDYSGRGMFGKTCVAIVCDSPIRAIELAAEQGIRGANQDSMGLQYIVYWRSIVSGRAALSEVTGE